MNYRAYRQKRGKGGGRPSSCPVRRGPSVSRNGEEGKGRPSEPRSHERCRPEPVYFLIQQMIGTNLEVGTFAHRGV